MTRREVLNHYLPQLIMIMEEPRKAMRYCMPWSSNKPMKNLIDNMPDNAIPGLFNIIKASKYKESLKPIMAALNEELKQASNS